MRILHAHAHAHTLTRTRTRTLSHVYTACAVRVRVRMLHSLDRGCGASTVGRKQNSRRQTNLCCCGPERPACAARQHGVRPAPVQMLKLGEPRSRRDVAGTVVHRLPLRLRGTSSRRTCKIATRRTCDAQHATHNMKPLRRIATHCIQNGACGKSSRRTWNAMNGRTRCFCTNAVAFSRTCTDRTAHAF